MDLPFRPRRADVKGIGVAVIAKSRNEAEHFTYYREKKRENQNLGEPFVNWLCGAQPGEEKGNDGGHAAQ